MCELERVLLKHSGADLMPSPSWGTKNCWTINNTDKIHVWQSACVRAVLSLPYSVDAQAFPGEALHVLVSSLC